MYQYEEFDAAFIKERVQQFRAQVQRRISGALTEEEFKPLRLMNGLYLQLHAYMLRIAIPYGTLSARQMHQLAYIARKWDKGYGHFTTRQNIQFNWPKLIDVPDILDALADVDMHAIQTSGNCVRNVTADHFAGAAHDEIFDPRPYAELLRQWSTDHPEFQFMPRKFKIAISGAHNDRAVVQAHDIGLQATIKDGVHGFIIYVGGGLGRTPMLGKVIEAFLPVQDLLPFIEAIIHVWNKMGRRDNKYKSRIKILVHEYGLENFKEDVHKHFHEIKKEFDGSDQGLLQRLEKDFAPPIYKQAPIFDYEQEYAQNPAFRSFVMQNCFAHRQKDYCIVSVSTKEVGSVPGDVSADQMDGLANIAKYYGHDEIRISHEQNVIFPHIHKSDLVSVYHDLCAIGLDSANVGLISDIIACPGMDYCSLATARSIPIAQNIAEHFHSRDIEEDIGEIKVKISGCINACGHHHLGHIGILGLDRAGVENYQITLGGDHTNNAAIGAKTGHGFRADEIVHAIDRLIDCYLDRRQSPEERFINCYNRLGAAPFLDALYGDEEQNKIA